MLTAHLIAGVALAVRLQLCAGVGQPSASIALEVRSSGAVRRLVRRDDSGYDAHELLGRSFASGDSLVGDSLVAISPAPSKAAGKNRTGDGPCDETQQMCCQPAKKEQDPTGLYRLCLERNCRAMAEPDPVCEEKGLCTKNCASGCCCFWLGSTYRAQQFGIWLQRTLVQFTVMVLAFEQGTANANANQTTTKANEVSDPQDVAAHAVDVLMDGVKILVGMPTLALIVVLCHARMMSMKNKLDRNELPPELMDPRARQKAAMEAQAKQRREINEFLDAKEQDRLGGIEQVVMAKLAGISDTMWMVTQAVGLGIHYVLVTDQAQTGLCVLGRSGRVLVLNRKPMLLTTTAASMIRGVGYVQIILVIVINTYFRAIERALQQARLSHDPEIKAKAAQAEPLAQMIEGKVSYITLVCAILIWAIAFTMMKFSLRPWGATDERNYYESKEACVGQYYRSGSRGLIPCLSRRRRKGGLRIFFGPYPESHIFNHLGAGADVLHNLEPCMMLPTEPDNGYPPSGSGHTQNEDEKVANAQLFLGFLNSFLGTLGLVIFSIHMWNFLTNVQNCPIGSNVRDCVVGADPDCTAVAKTPWFQHYVVTNKLRTQSEVVMDMVVPKVEMQTLSNWLRTKNPAETQQRILNISREACALRNKELYDDPNETLHSATSDTIGKFNSNNYLNSVKTHGYNITFDEATMHCKDCTRSYVLFYFTNFENLVELIEIMILMASSYISAKVYRMTTRKLVNCPMVDLSFASDPGSATELDVDSLERSCLAMIGYCFSFRYHYTGVPEHLERLEEEARQSVVNTSTLMDPWLKDSTAKSWTDYSISDPDNRRLMIVNPELLGILDGEEVVAAWSETPKLSTGQTLSIVFGFIVCFVVPVIYAVLEKSVVCGIEAVVMECVHVGLVHFYIFARRPQAGMVLTSRRLFQVSRLPAYRDLFGVTEPMVKLDVLVHNCSLAYGSMTMEAYTPLWRRVLSKVMNMPVYRRGQLIVEGDEGIFKLWRTIGDTREVFNSMSKVTYMTRLDSLTPEMGEDFRQKERAAGIGDENLPDPPCSCCCFPFSPVPFGLAAGPLLDRWVQRKPREKEVYGRKLTIRPATCTELYCGRGCSIECSCCCCCRLDELLTDFVVTTHRILVEQRSLQRYCRWCACCRETPNIRATFLAHHRAAAYLCQKEAQAFGLMKLKQDLNVKLLQKDAREYSAGLMLAQRPYVILNKSEAATFKDKLWVKHIADLYDIMTQDKEYADDENSSLGGGESDGSSFGMDEVDPDANPEEEVPRPGRGGRAARAKGKGPPAKGKGKGKPGQKGKGKKGKKGKEGRGRGEEDPADGAAAAAADSETEDGAGAEGQSPSAAGVPAEGVEEANAGAMTAAAGAAGAAATWAAGQAASFNEILASMQGPEGGAGGGEGSGS